MGKPFQLKPWHRAILIVGAAGMAAAALAWKCVHDARVVFLPGDRQANWILFPAAPEASLRSVADLDVVFRREFVLTDRPQTARLKVRAAGRFALSVNSRPLDLKPGRDWKDISGAELADSLHGGTNTIEVRVFNDHAPPALWLILAADTVVLRSDRSWEASFAGSAWRPAALAAAPRRPGPGNPLAGGEETPAALAAVWPIWTVFTGVAIILWLTGQRWLNRLRTPAKAPATGWSSRTATALLIVVVVLWVTLFFNNSRSLTSAIGFDWRGHLNYIGYLQQHRALPLPNEGWEMFQPPLYYGISAAALSGFGVSANDAAAATALRLVTMIFGLIHILLVFLSLRLIFPGRTGPQLVGLILAAFLPMQLYLAHYVTNETLVALLVSAALYLCLRQLRAGTESTVGLILLGTVIGAALLTKFTAALAVPFMAGALAVQMLVRRRPIGLVLRKLGILVGVALLLSAWHYLRPWWLTGHMVIGGWDPASGKAWWQDDGYHTFAYFERFGESLCRPWFSCTGSFLDGIYSTLWGDGLWGGAANLVFRPPWNYDLMCAGYLLAGLPAVIVLVGAVGWTAKLLREGGADRWLLFGVAGGMLAGLVYLNVQVPYYASAKSFYGLCALVPFCAFGAAGWEILTRGRRGRQFVCGTILVVWAMNSFAAIWIPADSLATRLYRGVKFDAGGRPEAALSEFARAVEVGPTNVLARRLLAAALYRTGSSDAALQQAEQAVHLDPTNAACHRELSTILAGQGQLEPAVNEARRAVECGPEDLSAWQDLSELLIRLGRDEQAVDAARNGLAEFPYSPDLHYALGLALTRSGHLASAADQFAYAVSSRPAWVDARLNLGQTLLYLGDGPGGLRQLQEAVRLAPDSPVGLNRLAWQLATNPDAALRNGPEAVRLAEHACATAGRRSPMLLDTLAAAYAETGRFPEAVSTAQEALDLARKAVNQTSVERTESLLNLFQSGRPCHERLTPQP
jgi:tetratricopeptide (TPR) repeat protein